MTLEEIEEGFRVALDRVPKLLKCRRKIALSLNIEHFAINRDARLRLEQIAQALTEGLRSDT